MPVDSTPRAVAAWAMTKDQPGLSDAYALTSPEANRRLYDSWATTYDREFAGPQDYLLPGHVARTFAAAGGRGPVLDIGAGTGLVGQHLAALGIGPVDGVDISPEMLEVAAAKGVYRSLTVADLTQGHPLPGAPYAGLVSSGTFTLGHLGPAAIAPLLDLAAPGALVVFSVNAVHFAQAGFAGALAALAPRLAAQADEILPIYGPRADPAHRDDRAHLLRMTLK